MPLPRLLTVGEAFEDLVFVGLERLPNLGEEIRTDVFHATIGGGAVITAIGAARLGVRTSILSALSPAAVAQLAHDQVRVTNLRRAHERHAITAALSTSHERTFVTFTGVNAVLEPRLLRAVPTASATHIHLALCPKTPSAWTRVVTRLRKRGITVSGDFGWNETLAADEGLPGLMDALDLVFLNELEAPLYAHATSLDDAFPRLRTARSNVVVKLGDQGSRWLRADGDVVMPAPTVNAIDTTGAGDAFNAGFLASWLRGGSPAECLATGNSVGAASTRRAGGIDGLPSARVLPARLRQQLGASARESARATPSPRKHASSGTVPAAPRKGASSGVPASSPRKSANAGTDTPSTRKTSGSGARRTTPHAAARRATPSRSRRTS